MPPRKPPPRSPKAPAPKPPKGSKPADAPEKTPLQHREGFRPSLTAGRTTMTPRAPRGSRRPKGG